METPLCPHRRRAEQRLTALLRQAGDEQASRVDELDNDALNDRIIAAIRAAPPPPQP